MWRLVFWLTIGRTDWAVLFSGWLLHHLTGFLIQEDVQIGHHWLITLYEPIDTSNWTTVKQRDVSFLIIPTSYFFRSLQNYYHNFWMLLLLVQFIVFKLNLTLYSWTSPWNIVVCLILSYFNSNLWESFFLEKGCYVKINFTYCLINDLASFMLYRIILNCRRCPLFSVILQKFLTVYFSLWFWNISRDYEY